MKTPAEHWSELALAGLPERAIAARDAEHQAALAQSRAECDETKARLQTALSANAACSVAINDLKAQLVDAEKRADALEGLVDTERQARKETENTLFFVRKDLTNTRRLFALASLASPSQPEPVKIGSTMTAHFDDAMAFAPIVPENAGTTCGAPCAACKELGGFTELGTPTRFFTADRVCGICGGSGVTK